MCIIKQPRGCVPEQLLLASESTVEAGGLFRACHGCKGPPGVPSNRNFTHYFRRTNSIFIIMSHTLFTHSMLSEYDCNYEVCDTVSVDVKSVILTEIGFTIACWSSNSLHNDIH